MLKWSSSVGRGCQGQQRGRTTTKKDGDCREFDVTLDVYSWPWSFTMRLYWYMLVRCRNCFDFHEKAIFSTVSDDCGVTRAYWMWGLPEVIETIAQFNTKPGPGWLEDVPSMTTLTVYASSWSILVESFIRKSDSGKWFVTGSSCSTTSTCVAVLSLRNVCGENHASVSELYHGNWRSFMIWWSQRQGMSGKYQFIISHWMCVDEESGWKWYRCQQRTEGCFTAGYLSQPECDKTNPIASSW